MEESFWRRGFVSVLALVLLGSFTSSPASASASGADSDSISAAEVAFSFRYTPPATSAPSRDRWLGRDKAKHVAVSALWTLSTQYVLVNRAGWSDADALPASVASAAAVGVTKELYDTSRLTGHFCGRDLVADAVGIGLAVGVIVL